MHNVENLIICDKQSQKKVVGFYKIIFLNGVPFLIVQRSNLHYAYQVVHSDNEVHFHPIHEDHIHNEICTEINILSKIEYTTVDPEWVVGLTYNEFETPGKNTSYFKISNNDKPLDFMPFVLQVGPDKVQFHEEGGFL